MATGRERLESSQSPLNPPFGSKEGNASAIPIDTARFVPESVEAASRPSAERELVPCTPGGHGVIVP